MRVIRHVHDMVREHHDQSGADVSERGAGRQHGVGPQRAQLPAGARPVSPLHTKRPLDRHQRDLRRPHPRPSTKAAQRPDQGERRSGNLSRLTERALLPRMHSPITHLHPSSFEPLHSCSR